ncbi:hypothetical protein QTO34_014509 [Cnephaeus nilssonii]|uniref:Uncharacterized protein n=1 Tax=Cnephaeus nilssonii TaxID=3371016 RepID=A0AA40LU46_CNENI|nr:hypothetical protein QTO34_014509 [Eptesicus nilssonii]
MIDEYPNEQFHFPCVGLNHKPHSKCIVPNVKGRRRKPWTKPWRNLERKVFITALLPLLPLAPADGTQRLGPAPAVGVSGGCCPDRPSGAGRGGEALRGNRGQQLLDGAKRLGLVPSGSSSAGSGCEWGWHRHASASTRRDHGAP